MVTGYVDLHLHTCCSDGSVAPEVIPSLAVEAGVEVVAITDHDTIDGVERAMHAAEKTEVEVIPGVELSTQAADMDLHILGYYIDWRNRALIEQMAFFREQRLQRARAMVERLNELGIDLRFETVLDVAGGGAVGRPHIADALFREELTLSYEQAFALYIGYDGPAYLPKYDISPIEAVQIILNAGGIPVLAHPGTTGRDGLIPEMVRNGLMGIEVYHPMHAPPIREYYTHLARTYGILYTGGSDFHGEGRGKGWIGSEHVPRYVARALARRAHG